MILRTLLGSCVAVCLHDARAGVGGMNHILLPGCAVGGRSARFGVQAMELLISQLTGLGADRRELVAKAFGGATVLPGFKPPTVGDHNAAFVREFLLAERIPLRAERLGGSHAVHVDYRTDNGVAIVRSVDGSRLPSLSRDEDLYQFAHLADTFFTGEATIY
jgi:chemotaxis protein CheD